MATHGRDFLKAPDKFQVIATRYLITLAPFNVSLAEVKRPCTEESAARRKWRVVKPSFTFHRPSRLPFGFGTETLMTDRISASALLFCHSHTPSCWHLFLLTRSWWQRVWCHCSNMRNAQCAVESKQTWSSHDPPLRSAVAETTTVWQSLLSFGWRKIHDTVRSQKKKAQRTMSTIRQCLFNGLQKRRVLSQFRTQEESFFSLI